MCLASILAEIFSREKKTISPKLSFIPKFIYVSANVIKTFLSDKLACLPLLNTLPARPVLHSEQRKSEQH
jgi:hypothetical protein